MTKRIGITGGIGTGKSFVSNIFKTLGVPFYDADKEAKALMVSEPSIREPLIEIFGQQVYSEDGSLNRSWLASQVFNDEEKLALLNRVVHPVVIAAGMEWEAKQTAAYVLKEAALLFESGSNKLLDFIIVVTAPLETRISRVMERDKLSRQQVIARMANQMPEEEKILKADFILINDGLTPLLPQIVEVHHHFIKD